MMKIIVLSGIYTLSSIFLASAEDNTPESPPSPTLTLERLFDSSEFSSESYGGVQWEEENDSYLRLEGNELIRYEVESGDTQTVIPRSRFIPPGENRPLSIDDYAFSGDGSKLLIYTNSKRVWRQNTRGDYWILDVTSRELKQLGGDAPSSSLMFATLSPNGEKVAYVHENNLYVQDVRTLDIRPLTTDGSKNLINGTFDWVYEEELGLRNGFRWSPDSESIAYWQLDTAGVRPFHLINNTDSLYPTIQTIPYPKTGETNAAGRVGVISLNPGSETVWMQVPGDPRNHYISSLQWVESPRALVLQQLNRLQNTLHVMEADPDDGTVRTVFTDHDEAWIDAESSLQWLPDDQSFLYLSDRDGWRHLYECSRDGTNLRKLTPGEFDVISLVGFDEEKETLYFYASPENPTQRYLYKASLDDSEVIRVTPETFSGTNNYQLSQNGRWAIHHHSAFGSPPISRLVNLPAHEEIRGLEDNSELREKLDTLAIEEHEFFRTDIGDGVLLDGWCIKPPDFDPEETYPVLFHVYGEPAGQTVLDRWGGPTYLWNLMLAQQGYVIMSIDNRGTPAPRGREWRKSLHRKIGVLSSSDQAAAAQALLEERPFLDPDRIAVWGWSGGGSTTLNLLFQYPEIYSTGMAIAFISNQRYYDTIYQERYMGLPSNNMDGYRDGSPITWAHQLEGNLLIVYGTGDDNCHYQNAEALINELVAHEKQFDMMIYPNRSHSISEGEGTTPHLYRTLTRYLTTHCPPNAAPTEGQ